MNTIQNQRGQGSGVFQLLISAVVALAILGVLLGIIGGLPNFGGQDPVEAARNTLKDAFTSLSVPKISSKVTLTKDNILTARGITPRESGVPSDKVCIGVMGTLVTVFKESQEYCSSSSDCPDGHYNTIYTYTGSTSRDIRISAICDDADQFTGDNSIFNQVFGVDPRGSDLDGCPNFAESSSTGTSEVYCLVMLRPV